MKSTLRIFATLLFALSLGLFTSMFGQTATTGTIDGTVTDQGGAAVPNATVTATSPNLIRAQSAQTDSAGRYQILNLPPGIYKVEVAETGGFAKAERTGIAVNLSRNTTADITLIPKGATAEVTITGGAGETVDSSSNTTGNNVSTEQFSNFPTQRTVQSLYTIAPTVSRSGLRDASGRDRDPSVGGSSGPENNYILDGVTTTDPAFGGSGANLPFEFVQEVEIKTGAFGAEYGKSTGGVFNVITKGGRNDVFGEAYGFFSTQGLVRETENFPFTGSAPNGFSEIDAGVNVGGPIVKDKLLFFGAFNPLQRKNYFLTQDFRREVNNEITTPFYAGKITWALNNNNTFNFSTFGDFTKQEGFLFGSSGFGADPTSFRGRIETGGHNYAARLNSTINPNWIGEFSFGLHYQRANTLPEQGTGTELVADNFAVLRGGSVLTPVNTNINFISGGVDFGRIAFVDGRNGQLTRNFIRQGFGLFSNQDRDRWEFAARLQNLWGKHTIKYGFEYARNLYDIATLSTGPQRTFGNPNNLAFVPPPGGTTAADLTLNGLRVTNLFLVCTTRTNNIVCPSSAGTNRALALIAGGGAPTGLTGAMTAALTQAEFFSNPFLIFNAARARDFELVADTYTNTESFYIQDDFKLRRNFTILAGLRWDYQQAFGNDGEYLKLNSFKDNLQPRLGFVWDFLSNGKSKIYANYARYLETPIPLDVNVRAGSDTAQIDKNLNAGTLNAPAGSFVTPLAGFAVLNLGHARTPVDQGLKPQTVNEVTAGIETEVFNDLVLGFRGVYRSQGSVIEDGSFDDGNTYFIFNPGEIRPGDNTTEELACNTPGIGCFGRARRYYRALEFSATKRFTNNFQFITSYVYSSLIGNYEGLFRNDNGQSDPNITSLFDLVSLLANTYGRLPNDRPHQFKFDGTYRLPFKLTVNGSFRAQSGIPFDQLIPHPIYGNNEGFAVPRGSAIVPNTSNLPNGNAGKESAVGSNRTPTTYNLDLGAFYPIQFSEKRELRLQIDWFNVFNNQRAIRLDTTNTINSGASGVPPVPNPFFGTGTIFQFPSNLRFGVKFKF